MAFREAFVILFVMSLYCHHVECAVLRESCDESTGNTCNGSNVVCTANTCSCNIGYQTSGSQCVVGLAETCPSGTVDTCSDTNAVCTPNVADGTTYTCQCQSSFYNSGSACETKVALGSECPNGAMAPCEDSNAECTTGGSCQCKSTHYNNGTTCETKLALDVTCPGTVPASCDDNDAECTNGGGGSNYTCQCKSTHYKSGSICVAKKILEAGCPSDVTAPCKDTNADCTIAESGSTYTCQCKSTHYKSGTTCETKVALNASCTSGTTAPCTDANAECTNGGSEGTYTCQCKSSHFKNGSTCETKVALEATCPSGVTGPCEDTNAECTNGDSGGSYTCQCKSTHYKSGSVCAIKVDLGADCGSTSACRTANSECPSSSGKCSCISTHYDSNGAGSGGTCELKKTLDAPCPNSASVPCRDSNAQCTSGSNGYTCQCTSAYFNNGGTCQEKKKLGFTCSSSSACGDTNAECKGAENAKTCQCQNTHYDDNGANLDGTCTPKIANGNVCPNASTGVTATDSCIDSSAECKDDGNGFFECRCKDGFYNKNGLCAAKIANGNVCPNPSTGVAATDSCIDSSAECKDDGNGLFQCLCKDGFYSKNGLCAAKVGLGSPCPQPDACATQNAVCSSNDGNGNCVCDNEHFDSDGDTLGGSCSLKLTLETTCNQPDACGTDNSECSNSKCVCRSDYYDGNGAFGNGGSCEPKVDLGSICPQQDACKTGNSVCSQRICICDTGFYDTNGDQNGGNCTAKVELGNQCPRADACVTRDAVCSNSAGGGMCICHSDYYDDNGATADGNCVRKVPLGSSCPMSDACAANNSECFASYCKCESNFYDDNTDTVSEGSCFSRKNLNHQCDLGPINSGRNQRDQCLDTNARCSYTNNAYYCSCNSGYHQEGTVCVSNKPLGGNCQYNTDCSDPNAECRGSKCTCGIAYYDNNGFENSGDCKAITALQVTGVTFRDVTTTSLTVSWTLPAASSYINTLLVTWTPLTGGEQGSQTLNSPSETSVSIATNITPGRAYTFSVVSRNTQTEENVARDTSTSINQAVKPLTPSGLQTIDLDASDDRLTLQWSSLSYISGYDVSLLKGSEVVQQNFTSNNNWYVNDQNLLNGERYNVTIVSRSQVSGNDPTAYVSSDTYRELIKTAVKPPDSPINPQCQTVDSYSIKLTWSPPTYPNGDLVQYNVEVFEQSNQGTPIAQYRTGTPAEHYTVPNLKPGFNYVFKMKTENEQYNSTAVTVNDCVTSAGKSSEPRNLTVSAVMSRSMTISWGYPESTNSEEIVGYILQIRDAAETCVYQQLFKCSDCIGSFQETSLTNVLCSGNMGQLDTMISKQALSERITVTATAGLMPDIDYTVSVSAVNGDGQGNISTLNQKTDEEEPQTPTDVGATDIQETSMIVTWKLAGPRPGTTNFTIHLTADAPAESPLTTVQGFDKTNVVVSGLQQNWGYQVSVAASTSIGSKTASTSMKYFTKPAPPGPVDAFTVQTPGDDYTVLQVSWKIPTILERNSNITGYVFKHNASASENLKSLPIDAEESYVYKEVVTVVPEMYYHLEVYARNDQDQNGTIVERFLEAPAGVPKNVFETTSQRVIPTGKTSAGQSTITLVVMKSFLDQTTNGQIRMTGLIGCEQSKCNVTGPMSLAEFNTMTTYTVSSQNGFIPYRITKPDWNTPQINTGRKRRAVDDEIRFTVGTEACDPADTTTFCNGPLTPGTGYSIIVVTCTNGGCLHSDVYGPFITEKVPDETNLGGIIGGVVGAVSGIAVVAVIIGVMMYKRRRKVPNQMSKMADDPEDITAIDDTIPRKRPVKLTEFEVHLKDMHRDSNLQFSAAYEDLKAISPRHSQDAANEEENKMRNRYINILPFDHSRVKLCTSGEDDKDDYINGNYLPGYRSPREYIGCQGPIPGTIDDFWRMVWEQNVSVVVMLTLCKEGQKIKCEQYWPNEVNDPKQFGDVVVEVTSYSSIKTFDYRVFKLVCNGKTRILKHFHFLSWLDFQANVQHEIILDFITQVRSHVQPPDTAGPMIVHCSAGVGRTGTYIVLDHLMQFIEDHDFDVSVDIFDMVMQLRDNRPHMVQTEQQFVFIHDCVKVLLERKRLALAEQNNIYENRAFDVKGEENIYQNQEEMTYENYKVGQMKTEL